MKLQVSYSELESIIREKTGQSVNIGYVNPQTIVISKDIKVLIVQKTVRVNVDVVEIVGTDLVLKYSAGLGLEMATKGILVFFKEALAGLIEETDQNTLTVHLDRIEKLEKALGFVDLQAISFDENTVIISFKMKE